MDRELEILIKFGLDPAAARQAVAELKNIKAESVTTGKEAVKAEEVVQQATEKTFTSKRQLKDMVKQLGHEFPILGQLGRLALNPVAAATAGLTAAFYIWHRRVEELKRSLGGIEMPDTAFSQVDKINATADGLARVATEAGKLGRGGSLKKQFEGLVDDIKFVAEMRAILGESTSPSEALRGEAAVKSDLASRLRAGAKTPMSEAREKELMAKEAEVAKKAEEELKKTRERQGAIRDIQGDSGVMGFFRQIPNLWNYMWRYGPTASGAQAMAMEDANAANQQGVINRFGRLQMQSVGRARDRADIATAGSLEAEVAGIKRQVLAVDAKDAMEKAKVAEIGQVSADVVNKLADAYTALRAAQRNVETKVSRDPR